MGFEVAMVIEPVAGLALAVDEALGRDVAGMRRQLDGGPDEGRSDGCCRVLRSALHVLLPEAVDVTTGDVSDRELIPLRSVQVS